MDELAQFDISAFRKEFRAALEEAVEIERRRLAENEERTRRALEDARAFTATGVEIQARIVDLTHDIAQLSTTFSASEGRSVSE